MRKDIIVMNKITATSLSLMLMGFFITSAYAGPVWSTSSCEPAEWTAMENNLLTGEIGVSLGNLSYLANNISSLTDGKVSNPVADGELCGFCNGSAIEWCFDAPKTIERIRLSSQTYWSGKQYHRINVTRIEIKREYGTEWEAIDAPALNFSSDTKEGNVPSATLEDLESGVIAHNVVALRFTFATEDTYAYYFAEIEAAGYTEAKGPVLGDINITPAKTKAIVSGSIADTGDNASACNVYLAIDGADYIRIAKHVTDSFSYQIDGLQPGTTYTYEIMAQNNAFNVKSMMRSGTFTTQAADSQTAMWLQSEYTTDTWTALENNILKGLIASESSRISSYASSDLTKLTDGNVPNPAVGSETVGFYPNGTVAWLFEKPTTIEKLRISSLWENTYYNGISVNVIHVKYANSTDWEVLNVPAIKWTGGNELGQILTLSDIENGFIAKNIIGLKITFGEQKAAVANYYAEIEAIKYIRPKKPGFSIRVR